MVRMLFVEGGAHHNGALNTACRRGFKKLLEKADLNDRLPRVIPCWGRATAFREFRIAAENAAKDHKLFLLVDSEEPVKTSSPWKHAKQREGDKWTKPLNAEEDHLHLMVQCMETWFLADRLALKKVFTSYLNESALPEARTSIEGLEKDQVYRALERATLKPGASKKTSVYDKGQHSFEVLALVDPARVRAASPWAERFFSTLERLL